MIRLLNNLFFKSIALRIFFLILILNTFTTFFLLFITGFGIEALEQTIINSDGIIELEHFKEFGNLSESIQNSSAQMILAYQPKNLKDLSKLPIIFNNVPIPFKGEFNFLDREYFVVTQALPEGNFYLAKSFEAYERQETFINLFIVISSLGLFIINLFLAFFISKKISQPIISLAEDIHTLPSNILLDEQRKSAELTLIAKSINRYHQQVSQQNEREKQFLQMASHELRTPVSVIAGAVEIIQHRNDISDVDKITFERIFKATNTMKNNITALLEVSRNSENTLTVESFRISELVQDLFKDYEMHNKFDLRRCSFQSFNRDRTVKTNLPLVRILLSNLIENALNHTNDQVIIHEQEKYIDIGEKGNFNSLKNALSYTKEFSDPQRVGLGLYIAHLACQRLSWKLEIVEDTNQEYIFVRIEIQN